MKERLNSGYKTMSQDTNVIGFYHADGKYGCFSNWYIAGFEYAGLRYSSVEQFMMYHKVLMFGQYELAEQILGTDNPAEIKRLGRTPFPEFDSDLWECTCYAVVKRGIRAKFEQNLRIFDILHATEEKILAECSLYDRKWGIGVAIEDPRCYDPQQWRGKNYLGRILMEVRDYLNKAKVLGALGYRDAKNLNFPLWNAKAGTLLHNPKYHDTIMA